MLVIKDGNLDAVGKIVLAARTEQQQTKESEQHQINKKIISSLL